MTSINDIRDRMLNTLNYNYAKAGITNANISEGSFEYLLLSSIASEVASIRDAGLSEINSVLPDTAQGQKLYDQCNLYNITRIPASYSYGYIIFTTKSTSPVYVREGSELTSPDVGGSYLVETGGYYSNNDYIKVVSTLSGSSQNISSGKYLKWSTTPAYADSKVLISTTNGGIVGGSAAETDDEMQTRLLAHLSNSPTSGNSGDVIDKVRLIHPLIQNIAVYPVINGPGTCHIALTQNANNTDNRTRIISDNTILATVKSTLENALPITCEYVVTSVQEQAYDLFLRLAVVDNSWIDAYPFPTVGNHASDGKVISVSGTAIQFVSSINPLSYSNKISISYLDTTDYTIYTSVATISTSTASGTYNNSFVVDATLSSPLTNIANNDFIFPTIINQDSYLQQILDYENALYPGEKTTQVYRLPRSKRYPYNVTSQIDNKLLKVIDTSNNEILNSNFYNTIPIIPVTLDSEAVYNAPYILKLDKLGFYPDLSSINY